MRLGSDYATPSKIPHPDANNTMIRFAAAVLLLTLSTAIVQADLLLDETVSVESSFFDGGLPLSFATVSKAAPLGTFDQDFNAIGSDMLWSVTWRAPAGQRIEVAAPADWPDSTLTATFRGGGTIFFCRSV